MQYEIQYHPVSHIIEIKLPELLSLEQFSQLTYELTKLGLNSRTKNDVYLQFKPSHTMFKTDESEST